MKTDSTTPRYRVPRITKYSETEVSLDDFDLDDIREYLRRQGGGSSSSPSSGGADDSDLCIEKSELDRIETLLLCGQRDSAREWVFEIVSKHIGRDLQ